MFIVTHALYDTLLAVWKWFPIVGAIQMALPNFYPAGKTSITSSLNVPGKLGWFVMTGAAPAWLIYALFNSSSSPSSILDLPFKHLFLVMLYIVHYINRAAIYTYLAPEIAPLHTIILLAGLAFNLINPMLIGSWLSSYGTIKTSHLQFAFGVLVWIVGFFGNIYHDHLLRQIRLDAAKETKELAEGKETEQDVEKKPGVAVINGRVYMIPKGGLFKWILLPNYFCECVEWAGFAIAAGSNCVPAIMFLINDISTILPRAFQQKTWYEKKFGKELNPRTKAVIPFLF